nr:MAG TPA: tail spike protein [Caudoviricetes sp.]
MPSVDELLNAAEITEATLTETNDVIEIDADTRTMIIPDTERIFGVMSDEKGERKYFRCKRFVGNGIDLSKLDLRVIYQNASGLESGKDKYIVTDLKTDGQDYVTFSWELSRKVTAYKGIISFIVCAIKTKTDGIITNEWNTTLANGEVLEGLEVDGTQEQEQVAKDYYNQLEAELLRVANEQKAEIKNIVKNKVDKPTVNDNNKIPRAKDGEVEWVEVGQPTDEQTNSAVKSWLNEHPEATTTVQDGSIEEIKINKNFLPYIKNDYFTPQMFGAKGDGVADDTESLKEALKHKCVFIPSGTYIISSMLEVKGHVFGADETASILKFINISADNYALTLKSNFANMANITIVNEYTDDNYENCEYNGINCDNVWNLSFSNIQVKRFKTGINMNNSWNNTFSRCSFSRCQTGVLGNSETNNVIFKNCFVKRNKNGVIKKDGTNFVLDGCDLSYNNIGFQQEGIGISTVKNCYFEQNVTSISQVYGLKKPDVVHVDNCSFYSLKIEREVVINITSGAVTISKCLFKNLGEYKPTITNTRLLLQDCTIIGNYVLYGKNTTTMLYYNVPGSKIYAGITMPGLAVLSIDTLPVTETSKLFTLPSNLTPSVGVRAYAIFKDNDENREEIEITVGEDGNVYTSKSPSKQFTKGHVTITYPIKS